MASLGKIIFWSMIILIVVFAAALILILALSLSGSQSDVESSNRSPIANLGKDVLLSCYIRPSSEAGAQVGNVAITWRKEGLSGLVYQYQNGAADLDNQDPGFRGRTELFPDAIASGNASLLLRSVRKSDDGVYSCEVSSSSGGGTVSIHLRTAAFSETNFTTTKDILIADGARWLPKPNVTWLDHDGNILNGTTTLSPNFLGIFHVVSTLQPVTVRNTYICRIENDLVTANSEAILTGSGVSARTYFIFSAAASTLTSTYLNIMTSVLCVYYLT